MKVFSIDIVNGNFSEKKQGVIFVACTFLKVLVELVLKRKSTEIEFIQI